MSERALGVAYIKGVADTFEDKIKIADQKATLILSLIVLMLVWSPDLRSRYLMGDGLGWLSAAEITAVFVALALSVALISAIFVVLPRNRRGGRALYWGAWPEARAEALDLALGSDPEKLIASYADHANNLAAICRSKYRCVAVAIWALIVALFGHGVALAIG